MRTLIFDESLSGHHLEYLHHYYVGACERPDEQYVICVPQKEFEAKKDKYDWPEAANITFEWLAEDDLQAIKHCSGSSLKYGWACSKQIARYAQKCKAQRVLLTNFIYTIPMLLWTMPKGISVRGIIYRIYLYNKRNGLSSKIRFAVEDFCYRLMARSRVMDKVFILNDQKSADELNEKFHKSKFTFLPDPVPVVDKSKLVNPRKELGIPTDNKVFFHFGGLTQRKGTLDILKAINMSEAGDLQDKTFVFAGRIYERMHDEFYQLLEQAKKKAQILVFDEFCEYDFLYNMCHTCDVILMPYHYTSLSSGILGYASVFQKPVIGPTDGLIGRLIKDYNMGNCLEVISAETLSRAFMMSIDSDSKGYARINDVHNFINIVLD